jgi:dihydrolipoamide dehydrogenase
MLKTLVPRTGRSLLSTKAPQFGPANLRTAPSFQIVSPNQQRRRGYASEASDYDVVFIGGGVAGYVGAIKAGQEGLKVSGARCVGCGMN